MGLLSMNHHFNTGDLVVSLVNHLPDIKSGDEMTVVSRRSENLYAVQLPGGELHRWFAQSELKPVTPNSHLEIGDCATVLTTNGHHMKIEPGTRVKIAKIIANNHFYDLRMMDGAYHRWLADFELAYPIKYNCAGDYY